MFRPKRYWFQSEDGTYYRNGPLVIAEMDDYWYRPRLYAELEQELRDIRRVGVTTKTELEDGDVVARRLPFSVSHPHMPDLSRFLDK
jgi:hypothetical protein